MAGVPARGARPPRHLSVEFTDEVLDDGPLKPALAARGILHDVCAPQCWWVYFNMEDPLVGGYTPERIALRRAISMAYDNDDGHPRGPDGRALPRNRRSRRTSKATSAPHDHRADLRPGSGARAARPFRLQGPRRRRLSRDPGRQAARVSAGRRRPRPRARPTSCGSGSWTRSASARCSGRTACRSCARWPARASCRCAPTAGTPTIRMPRTSCSCSTARNRPGQQCALQPAGLQALYDGRAHCRMARRARRCSRG